MTFISFIVFNGSPLVISVLSYITLCLSTCSSLCIKHSFLTLLTCQLLDYPEGISDSPRLGQIPFVFPSPSAYLYHGTHHTSLPVPIYLSLSFRRLWSLWKWDFYVLFKCFFFSAWHTENVQKVFVEWVAPQIHACCCSTHDSQAHTEYNMLSSPLWKSSV